MKLDSVRELKLLWQEKIIASAEQRNRSPIAARSLATAIHTRSLALGVSQATKQDYKLAIRVQQRSLLESQEVKELAKRSRQEVDIRYVGRIGRRTLPWQMTRKRPLQIGASVGHFKVTAGTLGCFVRPSGGGPLLLLSNNHVLANENHAKKGDAIVQPGIYDGGDVPKDVIGTLWRFKRLKKSGSNQVDAAVASLQDDVQVKHTLYRPGKKLKGLGEEWVEVGNVVWKNGRTTQVTQGRVTAFEMDNVVVDFSDGAIRFDNQIEIEGADKHAFSDGGDSGSLIVGEDHLALALLFAGSDSGGSNQQGLTYANPIHTVLKALDIELALD
ncbi:MAG: hypothetical protein ACKVY0_15110 [Prosthecobacter sp.]|uniref:hypothetical protein n=1 Tax=Prosthecobacter sp. TaxID=1965333 RepID=UPI0039045D2D